MKKRWNQNGFTLVELVIVLVVMAILAAAAIPTFMGYLDKTKKTICESQRGQLRRELTALEFSETGGQGKLLDSQLQALANELTGYRCQQNGTYTVTRGTDGVVLVICSVHDAQYHYDMNDLLTNLMDSVGAGDGASRQNILSYLTNANKKIDSTSPNGSRTAAITKALKAMGNDLGANGIQSWMMQGQNGNTAAGWLTNQYTLYWSTVDITKVNVGTWVKVIRYDSKTKQYAVGYAQVGATSLNEGGASKTYHTFGKGETSPDFVQSGEAASGYQEVVGVFASLEDTSATKP